MRRVFAVLSSVAVALGMLVGVTTPASAADLGTVTVSSGSQAGDPPTVSPSTIVGQVGDTFTFNYTGVSDFEVLGGAVSLGGSSCSSPSACDQLAPGPHIFTIVSAGSVDLSESGSSPTTFTIVIGGGSSGPTDPALVYPTLYLNTNGGFCIGVFTRLTKYVETGDNALLPGEPSCYRPGYSLGGWARSADATTAEFAVGAVIPIGEESFTLYAVWVPDGALITYDANIGSVDTCLDSAGVELPAEFGRLRTELNPRNLATAAPCVPANYELALAGWATSGDGPIAYQLGEPVTFPAGSRQRLYAVWQPTRCEQSVSTPFLTYSCVDFGDVPVGGREILNVRITNVSSRSGFDGMTVFPFNDVTATSNGTLERLRFRGPEECSAVERLDLFDSCIVRYAWTPAQAGPLSPVQLRVCPTTTLTCFDTPAGQGLRGNAYVPVTEPEEISVTTDEQPEEVTPALAIEGERGEVKGSPGVRATGTAPGFEPGVRLSTWLRFPGQIDYTQGLARPQVQSDGTFTWQRKTSKQVSVYFTSEDESVRSNTITFPEGPAGPSVPESLVIEGERGVVRGSPGVRATGIAPGFEPAVRLVTWLRFAGESNYTQGVARPQVQSDGTFAWQLRTSDSVSVYFTSEDGSVRSNTITFPAE